MSLRVVQFRSEHISAATELAAAHVAGLREQQPLLPDRWADTASYADRFAALIEAAPAAVALSGGRVVGCLGGIYWERAGTRNVHSPEWANVCVGEDARLVREELYAAVAEHWVADGRTVHYIGLLPHDDVAFTTLGWLGFGHSNIDGLRGLEPVTGGAQVEVRVAKSADASDALQLELGLRDHLAATPLFLAQDPPPTVEDVARRLDQEPEVTLLVRDDDGPVAFLSIGPASDDASTIIRDEGTASITGAFTRADRRGSGVATALLDAALAWARERGYARCSVDFESANLLAARFWTRHFATVGIAVRRRV